MELDVNLSVKNILVPTDFSSCSRQGVLRALGIAKRYGSSLILLHVVPTQFVALASQTKIDEAWRDIRRLEADLVSQNDLATINYRLLVAPGKIWPVVSDVLKKQKIDLIVMGTRGRTGLELLMLGSFAEVIFRRARVPVLTVGPRTGRAAPKSAPKQVLFATDFSEESEAAEAYAFSLAQKWEAKLTLLNAVEPALLDRRPGKSLTDRKRLDHARAQLEGAARRADDKGKSDAKLLAVVGSPVKTILSVANRLSADLIVLGISGPRRLADRLGWTNAYRIVCEARCPVLTIREPFPGPYFEKLFAMNTAEPRTEQPPDTSIESGVPKASRLPRR